MMKKAASPLFFFTLHKKWYILILYEYDFCKEF